MNFFCCIFITSCIIINPVLIIFFPIWSTRNSNLFSSFRIIFIFKELLNSLELRDYNFINCDFNNASLSFEPDGNDFIECDFRNAQITVLCCPGSVRFIDCIMPDGSKYTGDGKLFRQQ